MFAASEAYPLLVVVSGAAGGGRGLNFIPFSAPGGPFSVRTIGCCNLSLSKCNENQQFASFGGPIPGDQGSNLILIGPSQAQEGPWLAQWWPIESKVGEKRLVFIFWQGAHLPSGPLNG